MRCEFCNEFVINTTLVWGRNICHKCFEINYFYCRDCGETGRRDDSYIKPNGELVCWDCYRQYACWNPKQVPRDLTAKRLGSTRCFGIELETDKCNNYQTLRNKTVFGVKEDGSIDGMEFVSPILSGDAGIKEVRKFCRAAKKLKFTVDWQCGFHVHVDLRGTTAEQRKRIAYAYRLTFKFWGALVKKDRLDNEFCCPPDYYTPQDVLDGNYGRSRYEFINWRAYNTHSTVEIRGYQGTLDAKEICNWISAHLRFVDFVSGLSIHEIDALFSGKKAHRNLRKVLGTKLSNFYAQSWRERLVKV